MAVCLIKVLDFLLDDNCWDASGAAAAAAAARAALGLLDDDCWDTFGATDAVGAAFALLLVVGVDFAASAPADEAKAEDAFVVCLEGAGLEAAFAAAAGLAASSSGLEADIRAAATAG